MGPKVKQWSNAHLYEVRDKILDELKRRGLDPDQTLEDAADAPDLDYLPPDVPNELAHGDEGQLVESLESADHQLNVNELVEHLNAVGITPIVLGFETDE